MNDEINANRGAPAPSNEPPSEQRMFPIQGGTDIPWAAIAPFEGQAEKNHGGQSLEHLAERGGLGVSEAIHVLECVRWHTPRSKEICALSPRDAALRLHELATLPEVARLRTELREAREREAAIVDAWHEWMLDPDNLKPVREAVEKSAEKIFTSPEVESHPHKEKE